MRSDAFVVDKCIKIFRLINCIMVEIRDSVLETCFVSFILLTVENGLMREIEQVLKHSYLDQASKTCHFRRLHATVE
jgi:hypothetical protein